MRKHKPNFISDKPFVLDKKYSSQIDAISEKELTFLFFKTPIIRVVSWLLLIYGVLFLFFLFEDNYEYIEYWSIGLSCMIIGAVLVLFDYSMPTKKWILDREKQTLTVPHFFTFKHRTFSIHELAAKSITISSLKLPFIIPQKLLWVFERQSHRRFFSPFLIWKYGLLSDVVPDELWSFCLWYLDKNRPLPLGELLDPYRINDFERRRLAQFQPPLIYAEVLTPEHTSIEQKQREEFWKDETYCSFAYKRQSPVIWEGSNVQGFIPLDIEVGAVEITGVNNPHNWQKDTYPEFANFSYLPTAFAMRYEYSDGRVYYAYIDQKNSEVYSPPLDDVCKREIIR